MEKAKAITVFGSGRRAAGSASWNLAYEAGKCLADAGFVVVNGGYGGTMEAAAKGAKEAGGRTIGVTTDEFGDCGKNSFIDEEIRMPTWAGRLEKLMSLADGFVVLDGGTGTLAELMAYWEMQIKKLHDKPAAILGIQMQAAIDSLKANPEVRVPKTFFFVSSPEEAAQVLKESLACA